MLSRCVTHVSSDKLAFGHSTNGIIFYSNVFKIIYKHTWYKNNTWTISSLSRKTAAFIITRASDSLVARDIDIEIYIGDIVENPVTFRSVNLVLSEDQAAWRVRNKPRIMRVTGLMMSFRYQWLSERSTKILPRVLRRSGFAFRCNSFFVVILIWAFLTSDMNYGIFVLANDLYSSWQLPSSGWFPEYSNETRYGSFVLAVSRSYLEE